MDKWHYDEDEDANCYVVSPDNSHSFCFGNMEGTSKCCFDAANFVAKACNYHDALVGLLEEISNDPIISTYVTYKVKHL